MAMAQGSRWRKQGKLLLLYISVCLLYSISFSSDLASSIPYVELLLERCPREGSSTGVAVNDTSSPANAVLGESVNSSYDLYFPSASKNSSNVSGSCGGFGSSPSNAAWVASTYSAVRVGSAWLAGIVYDVFGARTSAMLGLSVFSLGCFLSSFANELFVLYITSGLVAGIGGGVLYALPVAIIDTAFSRRKRLRLALAFALTGIGTVLFAFAGREAISYGGWPWYYRMLGFISLGAMPTVMLLPGKRGTERARNTSSTVPAVVVDEDAVFTDVEVVWRARSTRTSARESVSRLASNTKSSFRRGLSVYRNLNFTVLVISYVILSLAYFFPILTAKHRAQSVSEGPDEGFLLVVLVGVGYFAGGLVVGVVVEWSSLPPILNQSIMTLASGLTCCLSVLVDSAGGLRIFILLYSFMTSGIGALGGPVLLEIVPSPELPHAAGQLVLFASVPLIAGPPAAGWLYEVSGSYTLPVAVGGVTLLAAGVLQFALHVRVRRQKASKMTSNGLQRAATQAERGRDMQLDWYQGSGVVAFVTSL